MAAAACKPAADTADDEVEAQPVEVDEFAAEAAATVCAQLFECSCGDNLATEPVEPLPWPDEAACVAEKQAEFQAMLDELLVTGGSFSPECGGEYIAGFARLRCDSAYDYAAGGGGYFQPRLCPLVVREQALGSSCTVNYAGMLDDCGAGKLCGPETQTCVPIDPLPVAEGRICEVEYIQLPCADGLVCEYFDGERICTAPLALGDACPDYDCYSDEWVCHPDELTCVAPAGLDESCQLLPCGPGLYCDGGKEFTCQAEFEYGHGCVNDNVCAEGGGCINNYCTAPPPAICYQD